MLRNTLAANDKYTVRDCVNLASPIKMQLPLKRTMCPDFSVPFLEYKSILKHFEKKDGSHSFLISEITDCERLG